MVDLHLYSYWKYMKEFQKVNINLRELEKDYWRWAIDEYIKKQDRNKVKYIISPYKTFMKTIVWLPEYKITLAKELWKYWTYLLSIQEYAREDNSIDMNLFKEKITFSDSSFIRLIKAYKDSWVLKKEWHTFYLNPLIVHYGKDIKLELWIMFKDELEKVGYKFN